jgi:DNA polymerase I-like protein with 3'-5' exonuclease and polymerase domains
MALAKQGHMSGVMLRDLRRPTTLPPENYNLAPSLAEVAAFTATEFSFDFEWDSWGQITLCGLSDRMFNAMVVPFQGAFVNVLRPIFENATDLIGQNIIGADLTHIAKLGWQLRKDLRLHDTMLMQHLTMPDHRHGLAFIGSVLTNKNFWKGSDTEEEDSNDSFSINGAQWKTWDKPGALVRAHGGYGGCTSAKEAYALYNARDTDGTYQAWWALKYDLKKYDLEHVYWNVSIPAAKLCQRMGSHGLRLDHTKLKDIQAGIDKEIATLEQQLPPELAPRHEPIMVNQPAPPDTYKQAIRKYKKLNYIFTRPGQVIRTADGKDLVAPKMKPVKIIKVPSTKWVRPYNSDQFVMEWVAAAGGKTVLNQKTKRASADKTARQIWQRQFSGINPQIAKTLGELGELKRLSTSRQSFAKEGFLGIKRVYYNILAHGTAEGRFSSSGQRKGLDPNIQNQPKEIRKLFVPDNEACCFLSVDISQGENELTALLSNDTARMKNLRTIGYDEHSETASIAMGLPVTKSNENKHLRQVGKKVNHMTNYGAGAKKVQEALALEGFPFTLKEVQDMLVRLALGRPALTNWQKSVIAQVEAHKFCCNPFGRKRWFQDKRFAPKAMAFGPASTLADCVIRMMIACHASEFTKEIAMLQIATCGDLPEGWDLRIQVHDELCFHGPIATLPQAAQLVRDVMTQPWAELDGFAFNIDMAASKVAWGYVSKYNIGEELTW